MKAILLSIKPEWVAKILIGEKTIEVRKKFPKDYVGWVYLYCSKNDNLCRIKRIDRDRYICGKDFDLRDFPHLSSGYDGKGKVVARFWCDRVLPIIKVVEPWGLYYYTCKTERFYYNPDKLKNGSCLNDNQLNDYLGDKGGYAIHFSKLEIFDRPRELSEFWNAGKQIRKGVFNYSIIRKAPQNYCYIEE